MLDALGSPQSLLVLGASSDIAQATVAALAARGRLNRVVLAGRPGERRDAAEASARALPGMSGAAITAVDFEASDSTSHSSFVDAVFDAGEVDVALVAFGVLPDAATVADPSAAADVVTANFTGAVSALTAISARMRGQGHGVIVVLSSVAGERPRRSNYLYGATKAGLDAFATGLGDSLHGSGVSVVVVRPGFVRTKMTHGMDAAPLAVGPDEVAQAIVTSLRGPSRTVWVPRPMRPVMSLLRHLPRTVFRRLPI